MFELIINNNIFIFINDTINFIYMSFLVIPNICGFAHVHADNFTTAIIDPPFDKGVCMFEMKLHGNPLISGMIINNMQSLYLSYLICIFNIYI